MKKRYRLIHCGNRGKFYCVDTTTGRRTSLETQDRQDAQQLVEIKNQAARQPEMNLQIAQIYLQHCDPALKNRTWQNVVDQIVSSKTGPTGLRWGIAAKDVAFDLIRNLKLLETTSEHFLRVLKEGTISTNVCLRRIHNYAVGMHWLPWPVLPRLHWPKIEHKVKRAITMAEHQKVIAREYNPATRAYYQLLWYLGGSQSDAAALTAEDIDWNDRTISYQRHKTTRTAAFPCCLYDTRLQCDDLTPGTKSAGVIFDAGVPSQFGHQMRRNEVAKLAENGEFSCVGLDSVFFHALPCGKAQPFKPTFFYLSTLNPMGRQW